MCIRDRSCSVLWAILDRFDRVPRITRSVISEAFICYLVIAIAFSQLYWGLSRLIANPFNQIIPESQSGTFLDVYKRQALNFGNQYELSA